MSPPAKLDAIGAAMKASNSEPVFADSSAASSPRAPERTRGVAPVRSEDSALSKREEPLQARRGMMRRKSSKLALPLLEGSLSLSSMADLLPAEDESDEDICQKAERSAAATGNDDNEKPLVRSSRRRPSLLNPSQDFATKRKSFARRASVVTLEPAVQDDVAPKPWILVGVLSVVWGVLSVVPYNMILRDDPGSPLFIGLATHIFFVIINTHNLKTILFKRKIPLKYHAAFVALGFAFTYLKSDAFVRLPASMCMLLLNLQLIVAMAMQRACFGDRYSLAQYSGCALITVGVAVGGLAARKPTASSSAAAAGADSSGMIIGILEMLGALVALTALSVLVKVAFSRYGESVEEQIVMQHLGALPLFFVGGQWAQIGPRFASWFSADGVYLLMLLLANMSVTFLGQATQVQFAGRAPNLLIVQLVDTLKKFISLLLTALLGAPPFPPLGFWIGSLSLVLGTVQFLSASQAPQEATEKEKAT
eukprot:TRINITY_DN3190_c0_g1_i1.p1 TRINITY_DN3190_c0_g1~~TRINITY_DN3190_c0_g1_i1.p1  ORF type:complete len:480 (-),score=96.85 TRINITY_DN3190_c0_g1_i1:48-1487(-)